MNGVGCGASVSLNDLEKSYDRAAAVAGVSLDIHSGEFLTLLGPSGSGKTTTLMMIAGFETPTGGDIAIDGKSVVAVPPYRRNIGMVFQNYALFPHLTVADQLCPLSLGDATLLQRKANIVTDREMGKQSVVLEHHADVAAIRRHGDDRLPVDGDVAAGRRLEAGDHHQGCRLAGPARPEQRQEFTGVDVERNSGHRSRAIVALLQVVERYRRAAADPVHRRQLNSHLLNRSMTLSRFSIHQS